MTDDADDDNNDNATAADAVEGFDVCTAFDSSAPQEYHLPCHHRCACHMLNSIATTDADKAESDPTYKKISHAAFSMCQALWNKYGRSTQAVEAVTNACGLGVKRPNATRWNSLCLAVEWLVYIV